jgi:hypothetical protein
VRLYRQRSFTELERAKYELAQWAQSVDPVRGWIASPGLRCPVLGAELQDPRDALRVTTRQDKKVRTTRQDKKVRPAWQLGD